MAKIKRKSSQSDKKIPASAHKKKLKVKVTGQRPRISPSVISLEEKREILSQELLQSERTDITRSEPDTDNEKLEKTKLIIMWSGISFFMLLIVSIWIYTFSLNFKSGMAKEDSSQSAAEIKNEFNSAVSTLKDNLAEIKKLRDESASKTPTSTLATTTEPSAVSSSTPQKKFLPNVDMAKTTSTVKMQGVREGQSEIEALKKKLDELESKLNE
jgi:hypothetical protein